MKRVHWSEGRDPGAVFAVTLCGQMETDEHLAAVPEGVTCKKCLVRLRDMIPNDDVGRYVSEVFETRVVTEYDRGHYPPPPPLIDPLTELPVLNPYTWSDYKLGDRASSGPVWRWFIDVQAEAHARPWAKRHRLDSERYRWPSVTAALEWLARLRTDGYPMGSLSQQLVNIGRLGTVVGVRGDGQEHKALVAANDAHAIDLALATLYRDPSKWGLSRRERLWLMFQVAVGLNPVGAALAPHTAAQALRDATDGRIRLTGPRVSAVVREGKLGVYEQLRGMGLLPPARP